ncbi:MAG TPA: PLP-dependent aminotransferase family protein [Rectinema sp.]|nr:PLP-dependent aminotransferase family protein [Rectinema sp.]HPN02806.1 PLP-dependent aminotransferase family protein [Rectinema sp.]
MQDLSVYLSANAHSMKKSVIRELLKLTNQPDIISFAGGLPAPETFPIEELRVASDQVFRKYGDKILQYGTTEGDNDLKARIIEYESSHGIDLDPDNILITSASQQALDMVPKLFLDPGEYVIAERPTYLGAIQAIQSYQGKVLGIPFSHANDGLDMDELERKYARAKSENKRIKYIYVIPDFQNPTGVCWSLEKRKALIEFAYREGLFIVEDAPYRELRFMGEPIPSLYQLELEMQNLGIVIGLKTFSKILAPGTRIGWILARKDIIQQLVVAKQAVDLCTSPLTQKIVAQFMATGKLEEVLKNTCAIYRDKRNFMLQKLDTYMPKHPDLTWTKPEGGLFLWLSLPSYIDTDKMFYKAIEKKVAYVVGSSFYYDDPEVNSMRINFSYSSYQQIEEGVKRLADTFKEEIEAHEAGL